MARPRLGSSYSIKSCSPSCWCCYKLWCFESRARSELSSCWTPKLLFSRLYCYCICFVAWCCRPSAPIFCVIWNMSVSAALFKGDSMWSGGGLLASASSVISLSFSMAWAPSTPSSVCMWKLAAELCYSCGNCCCWLSKLLRTWVWYLAWTFLAFGRVNA